jgi:hypothetical protein
MFVKISAKPVDIVHNAIDGQVMEVKGVGRIRMQLFDGLRNSRY